ncbi:MAG: lipoyl synthase [Dysgonamonadaceae bacterium]|jgi:lipoic acid synthetase|nr:lipoyl synthase [Dysgonamonadaceae bacterium]
MNCKNNSNRVRKPEWLKVKLGNNQHFSKTGTLISSQNLHTICQSGRCPNLGECWNRGAATFMIGGDICTRSCKFCNTRTGRPEPLDPNEPLRVALAIKNLELKHAVITSVDRDDLPDCGAIHWVETVRQIKLHNPTTTLEILIPDFKGNTGNLNLVIKTRPEIISHNMETVRRLTPILRSAAQYERSLTVLKTITESGVPAKTGLMLGMGETENEVAQLMNDLLATGCRLISIGQYLQPSHKHFPVSQYVHPDTFAKYREQALSLGFLHVESGPLVRSSYRSEAFLKKN